MWAKKTFLLHDKDSSFAYEVKNLLKIYLHELFALE